MNFPEFREVHYLIPRVLDLRPTHTTRFDYDHIEDPDEWETYVKYRKIVSHFLTDRTRFPIWPLPYRPPPYVNLFVAQEHYVSLAIYLLRFISIGLW